MGHGNHERVKETLKRVYIINIIIGIFFNIVYLLFPGQLVSIFGSGDNELYIEFAISMFRIFLMITFVNSFEITTSIVIQSLGNAKKATACSFIRQIILFIPISLILAQFFGLNGILFAGPISDIICFIIVIFIFKSEYKKLGRKVSDEKEINNIEIKQNKKGIIITINREYASGGRYVGKLLAKALDIPFYDKEIISLAAKESGFTKQYIQDNEQKKTNMNAEYNSDDKIFIAETEVIKKIAENSAVIVGRCADYILKDNKKIYKIFLYSNNENKVKRATKYYGIDKDKALSIISKVDKQREKHYKYYTGKDWKDFSNYDLAINVDTLGAEKTALMIKDIINSKTE